MLPQWFVFVLISVVGLVSAELAQRVSMKKVEDISPEANNFIVWLIVSFVGLVSSLVLGGFKIQTITVTHFLYFIVIGSLYFWAGKLFYSSYKGISAAVGTTILTFSVVITTTLGILFLNEDLSLYKLLGILMILLGIFILNYGQDFKLNKYALLALSGAAIFGVAYTVDKAFVLELNPYLYLCLVALSSSLMGLVFAPKVIFEDITKKVRVGNLKVMLLSGLSFGTYLFFTFKAYDVGADVGVVDAINNTSVFGIILIEYLFLQERTNILKKVVSAIIAITGVALLVAM